MHHDLLVRAAKTQELAETGDLIARIFANGDVRRYERTLHRWNTLILTRPGFEATLCRIGLRGGQVVAAALVTPFVLRYGQARLRAAGLGLVCTHPDERRRGWSAAVVQDALAYMAEQGAHMSLLNDTVQYYARFGFYPVCPHYALTVDSAAAALLEPPHRLRSARPPDLPQIARLYEKHWGGRSSFVRTAEDWLWRVQHEDGALQVVDDGQGAVCGYLWQGEQHPAQVEVVADSQAAACTLLAACGRLLQGQGLPELHWPVPPDDALTAYVRNLLPVTLSARYHPNGGWMARLIDSGGLVRALLPEICAQARSMDPGFDPDALLLDHMHTPEVVQIMLRGRPESACELNHRDFVQLLFGSLRPAALAVQTGLRPAAVALLESLFPPRTAAVAPWDWF